MLPGLVGVRHGGAIRPRIPGHGQVDGVAVLLTVIGVRLTVIGVLLTVIGVRPTATGLGLV